MAKAYEYVVEIRAGFNKLSNDIRQVSGNFKRLERDVTGIFKNIGAVAKSVAVIGGVYAVNQLKNAIVDLAKKGEAAGSVAEGFQKLGGSVKAIEDASRATLGLVGKFELMKQANQAMLKGIPDVNANFAMLAEYAGRVANTLDQDTGTALNNLINGLATVKEKQLAAIGVTINSDEAFRKYAEANNIAAVAGKRWQDVLTDQEQKLAKQREAIEAVRNSIDKLAPVTDSVANAEAAYKKAIDDGITTMGIAINSNEDLAKAYRELETAVRLIDWEELGRNIAGVASVFASMASTTLPWVAKELENLARFFNIVFGDSTEAQIDRIAIRIGNLQEEIFRIQNTTKSSGKLLNFIGVGGLLEDFNKEKLNELMSEYQKLNLKLSEQRQREAAATEQQVKDAEELQKKKEEILKADRIREEKNREIAAAIKESAAQAQQLANWIDSEMVALQGDAVSAGLEKAINDLDETAFANYVALLKEQTKEAIIKGRGEAYSKADAATQADVQFIAGQRAEQAAMKAGEKFKEAQKEASEEGAKYAEQKYQETADSVRNAFTDAFRAAASGDWRDSLIDFIGSLAGALTAAFQTGITQNPSVIQGLADLGVVFGNFLAEQFGATGGGGAGGTAGALGKVASAAGQSYFNAQGTLIEPPAGAIGQNADGTFMMPDGTSQPGVAGASTAANIAGYAQAAGTILGTFQRKPNKNNNSVEGSQVGATGGAVIGSFFGAPEVGAMIGDFLGGIIGGLFKKGPQNPQTKARIKFEQWLEDQFKNLGNVRFFGPDGVLQGYFDGNIKGKQLTKDFNPTKNPDGTTSGPVWVENMKKWGDQAFNTFVGLGEAMKEILGISDAVGAQLGYILGTNLSGNIDNARLLVQQLGISFEQVSEALLNSALKGQISWLAFNSYIRDTAEAFKPGLAAVGAIGDAFRNLIDSAGQGREAVKSFKDIAVEAMEAGVKTMDELRAYLLAKGFDPEYVDALINSAIQRGVDTLEEMANASDSTAGAIVGDMEAMSSKLREAWEGMREDLQKLSDDLKEIPKEVKSEVKIKVKTEYDQNTRDVMEKMPGTLPPGVPPEGERESSQTASASTGRTARSYSRVLSSPSIKSRAYAASSRGSSTARMAASSSPVVNINIDATNAGAGVEQAVYDAARAVEARVVSTVVPLIKANMTRGGRGGDY